MNCPSPNIISISSLLNTAIRSSNSTDSFVDMIVFLMTICSIEISYNTEFNVMEKSHRNGPPRIPLASLC